MTARMTSLSAGTAVCARDLRNQIAGDAYSSVRYQPHPDDLIGLEEIFASVNRTPKWGFANNIIPIYDDRGEQRNKGKPTPFPFEQLPPAVLKTGKKSWQRARIDAWRHQILERVNAAQWMQDRDRGLDEEAK